MNNHWSIEVSLRLGEHGWSYLDLWNEEKHKEYVFTHVFDSPLQVLADLLVSIARGSFPAEATLHEEPGSYRWTVNERIKERHLVDVQIREHRENFEIHTSPIDVYEFTVAKDFLIQSFLSEFDKIQAQMENKYFKKNRDAGAIPWSTISELKQYLNKKCEQGASHNERKRSS